MNGLRMVPVTQQIYSKAIPDVESRTREELRRAGLKDAVKPGDRIALTAGSRGITNIVDVLRGAAREVEACGGKPFIVPSMGSHGGATDEGQIEVLRNLGVTEDSIGVPILSNMNTETIGQTPDGHRVFVDRNALGADGIIAINRIKSHTDFRGNTESGLTKIMAIGLGKRDQAEEVHSLGSKGLRTVIPPVAQVMLEKIPIRMGIAILENGYGHACDLVAVKPEEISTVEPKLLKATKKHAPKLPFDEIDVLIVDYIGKEISGAGMDTNVIGRLRIGEEPWTKKPVVHTIVLRDLTEASHGNAAGTGLADIMVQRVLDKMDRDITLTNTMVSTFVERAMIPPTYPNDQEALETAFYLHRDRKPENLRVVRIKSTLHLERMYVSEGLLAEGVPSHCSLSGTAAPISLDEAGNITGNFL
jgi:hypothetical protein